MRRLINLSVVCSVLLAPAMAHAAPSLASINVHLSDLASGFKALGSLNLADVAAIEKRAQVRPGTYARMGLVACDGAAFLRGSRLGESMAIGPDLCLLRTTEGAHSFYLSRLQDLRQRIMPAMEGILGSSEKIGQLPVRLGALGDERYGQSFTGSDATTAGEFTITFLRRGRYVLELVIGTTRLVKKGHAPYGSKEAAQLTSLVDHRAQHAQ